ncbi:MAG: hypothetical protein HYV09_01900 [Deltaproteobacteria bacterium]|nr:hypothetical protein [Deltaproteobacteria bacterium]
MKRTWRCPKCNGARIGYFETLPDSAHGEASKPRMIGNQVVGSFLGLQAHQGAAPVEAFVCTECGYFEEYVKNPTTIPWDQFVGFRWCAR